MGLDSGRGELLRSVELSDPNLTRRKGCTGRSSFSATVGRLGSRRGEGERGSGDVACRRGEAVRGDALGVAVVRGETSSENTRGGGTVSVGRGADAAGKTWLFRFDDLRGGMGGGVPLLRNETGVALRTGEWDFIFRADGERFFARLGPINGGVGRGSLGGGVAGFGMATWSGVWNPISSIMIGPSPEELFLRALRRMTLVSLNARSCALAICESYSETPN